MNRSLIRVNADDFGISPGVNNAVISMFKNKKLHSTSIMTGGSFFNEAIDLYDKNKNLKIGLHFCLTTGKSECNAKKLTLLVDNNGNFKYGFLKLLLLSIFQNAKLKQEVELELRSQLDKLQAKNIIINHIDGHRHIHTIPAIWNIVTKVANEYNIPMVRHINENLFNSIFLTKNFNILKNGGIIKWFILRFLNIFNKPYKNEEKFFSILYTCNITEKMFLLLQKRSQFKTEIMIHPSDLEIDKNYLNIIKYEQNHLQSSSRLVEYWK